MPISPRHLPKIHPKKPLFVEPFVVPFGFDVAIYAAANPTTVTANTPTMTNAAISLVFMLFFTSTHTIGFEW
ncbi:MAG: hypothetical protein ABSA75_01750 [Candidatus Bathyarchaeia archaeon]